MRRDQRTSRARLPRESMSTLPRASLAPQIRFTAIYGSGAARSSRAVDKLASGRLQPRPLEVRFTERQVGEPRYPHAISAAAMLPHNSLAFSGISVAEHHQKPSPIGSRKCSPCLPHLIKTGHCLGLSCGFR